MSEPTAPPIDDEYPLPQPPPPPPPPRPAPRPTPVRQVASVATPAPKTEPPIVNVSGYTYLRFLVGQEGDGTPKETACPECKAAPGSLHVSGCRLERSPHGTGGLLVDAELTP